MRRTRGPLTIAVAAAFAAALAAPAGAGATVYCVPNTGVHASCETAAASVSAALNAAGATPAVADTVRIGAGTFAVKEAEYDHVSDAELDVIGAGSGPGGTVLDFADTSGNSFGLKISASAGSEARDFSLVVGAPIGSAGDDGLQLDGLETLSNVNITGPSATNAIGLFLTGDSLVDHVTVDMEVGNSPTNYGTRGGGGDPVIEDSTLIGDTAADSFGGGATLTVRRSRLVGAYGFTMDAGTIVAENVLIDLGTVDGAAGIRAENQNLGTSPYTVDADHLTIAGGGAGSIGVAAVSDSEQLIDPGPPANDFDAETQAELDDTVNDGETADVTLTNSVISGPETGIYVAADRGEHATVTSSYNDYTAPSVEDDDISGADAVGFATLAEDHKSGHAAPGFVNPATGDYHLLATSPLIDIGDPAFAPGPTDIDLDGRVLDGLEDCSATARTDIGADEFVGPGLAADCVPPQTSITSGPSGPTTDPTPTFGFAADEAASFQCRFDSAPFTACSAAATHTALSALAEGQHTFEVVATDLALNADPTPAARAFTVDTTAPVTKLKGKPKLKLKGRKRTARASFTFSSEAGATFACSLDSGAFATCSSPFTAKVRRGRHTLRVRATDGAGNVEATPASFSFRVVKRRAKK